jgi:hypothetical protein
LLLQVEDAIILFWLLHNLLSHYEAMHVRVHQNERTGLLSYLASYNWRLFEEQFNYTCKQVKQPLLCCLFSISNETMIITL